jgi:hypothetical protein
LELLPHKIIRAQLPLITLLSLVAAAVELVTHQVAVVVVRVVCVAQ